MRKRYRYVPELDAVLDVQELAQQQAEKSFFFLPDISAISGGGFLSPIDETFISSRSQLREHNIRHDVVQNGEIRGEVGRQMTKKTMDWDPSLIGRSDSFNWSKSKSTKGNLTEI
jgi:hypothetical protein